MKIFEDNEAWGGKVNFVDDNNVLVGFDNSGQCCESFGWFLGTEEPVEIQENDLSIDVEGFNFDTKFFKEVSPTEEYTETAMAVFRLVKGSQVVYLTLHNSHNGYYSHGFEMKVGGTTVFEGSL